MAKQTRSRTTHPVTPQKKSQRPPQIRKSLGRGLAALIPDDDMAFLSRIARGEETVPIHRKPDTHILRVAEDSHTIIEGVSASKTSKPSSNQPAESETVSSHTALNSNTDETETATVSVQWISISQIEANPYQPRRTFAPQEMEDLALSIREHGVLQPIILRPTAKPESDKIKYQLVAGERRWRAAQKAELDMIPAIVRSVNDQQALELALIENIQRHDISPMDAAHAYQRLATEFRLSQEKVAERVGKSRSAVANTLRLLDLPEEMQQAIEDGRVSEGHGRALLAVPAEGSRRALFRRILRDGLSVREAERFSKAGSALPTAPDEEKIERGQVASEILTLAELKDIEQRLQRSVGTRLQIKPKKRGGQIILEYFSLEELDRLVNVLSGSHK